MWVRVELADIAGHITGFTVPRDDLLYLLTMAGLVRMTTAMAALVVRRLCTAEDNVRLVN